MFYPLIPSPMRAEYGTMWWWRQTSVNTGRECGCVTFGCARYAAKRFYPIELFLPGIWDQSLNLLSEQRGPLRQPNVVRRFLHEEEQVTTVCRNMEGRWEVQPTFIIVVPVATLSFWKCWYSSHSRRDETCGLSLGLPRKWPTTKSQVWSTASLLSNRYSRFFIVCGQRTVLLSMWAKNFMSYISKAETPPNNQCLVRQ